MVKNPPAKQEIWVRSLGQENPLQKEMATHSSILAWRIPRTEKPSELRGRKGSDKRTNTIRYYDAIVLGLGIYPTKLKEKYKYIFIKIDIIFYNLFYTIL